MPGQQPAQGDILQVRFCCYTAKQISLNILHYRVLLVTASSARISAMAVQLNATMDGAYKLLMPPEASFRGVGVKNITPVETIEQTITTSDGPGTGPPGLTPTQSSYVVKLGTDFAGRGHRGRVYPGFIPEDYVDPDGQLTAPAKTALANWATNLPQTVNVSDTPGTFVAQQIILRRIANGVPLPFPTWDPVTSVAERTLIGTQRRRGEFGRQNVLPF